MDKVQKTAFTDYNAPSSEAFRLHLTSLVQLYIVNGLFQENSRQNLVLISSFSFIALFLV
jgi:hypothetical protein